MTLAPGCVHVWVARLNGQDAVSLEWLDAHERARAARYRARDNCRRYVRSVAALRAVLSLYVGVEPARIAFERSPSGKPALSGQLVEFSSSRSRDIAVAAVASTAIGIDVERIRPELWTAAFAHHVLGTEGDCSPSELTRLWTRREAAAKLRGTGIGDEFSATRRDGDVAFDDIPLGPEYVATVAGLERASDVLVREVHLPHAPAPSSGAIGISVRQD